MLSESAIKSPLAKVVLGLNPCCNGRCSLRLPNFHFSEEIKIVLILVVMEDALWVPYLVSVLLAKFRLNPCCNGRCSLRRWEYQGAWRCFKCLNPCCNGRCSLRQQGNEKTKDFNRVLILVVMEDALWEVTQSPKAIIKEVLILVVMEDALWEYIKQYSIWMFY